MPFAGKTVFKCAAGYDFIMILARAGGPLLCYYQSAFYRVAKFEEQGVLDVATTDNMVVIVDNQGQTWIMEFNADKIVKGDFNMSRISLKECVTKVFMGYG